MVSFKSLWMHEGEYGSLATADERNLASAKSAIFLVNYYLVKLGYFLGLSKSIDPGENCSIPWIYGGLLKRNLSFDS